MKVSAPTKLTKGITLTVDQSLWQEQLNSLAYTTFTSYLKQHQVHLRLIEVQDNCLVFSTENSDASIGLIVTQSDNYERFMVPKEVAINFAPDFYVSMFFSSYNHTAVIQGFCTKNRLWQVGNPEEYQGKFGIVVNSSLINQNISELLWQIL